MNKRFYSSGAYKKKQSLITKENWKTQKYTPDFYLPEYDLFVEIKNFLSEFSKERDSKFRKIYPDSKLFLLLKPNYLELQNIFSSQINEWEYS